MRASVSVKKQKIARPGRQRRMRLGHGITFVMDGPFAETKEVIAGYWHLLACTECRCKDG